MRTKSEFEALGIINGDLTVIRFRLTCQRQAIDEMRAKGQDSQDAEVALDELTELYRERSEVRERLLAPSNGEAGDKGPVDG